MDIPAGEGVKGDTPSEALLAENGIRKRTSKHLTLFTDLPASPEIDELPALFDQAVPQWCAYFDVDPRSVEDWRLTGYLMKDKAGFKRARLLGAAVPEFNHGYSIDHEFWLFDQPSDYYRRHLLLHEGTHAFMNTLVGGCGPDWYMEGIAELLATHRLVDGKLTLNEFPESRDEVPMWGRIKIVQDAVAAGRSLSLGDVQAMRPNAEGGNLGYGWCWAAAAFLDGHPRYRERFRQLAMDPAKAGFNERFGQLFADVRDDLLLEWQLFIAALDYGYDFDRAAIEFTPITATRVDDRTQRFTIAADRGWQSTGYTLEAGQRYRLQARGQYEVAQEPRPWISEPNGVSIRYFQGRPVGQLLAAVRPETSAGVDPSTSFRKPLAVGPGTTIKPSKSGVLYLKINDSPAKLSDNRGTLQVEITRE